MGRARLSQAPLPGKMADITSVFAGPEVHGDVRSDQARLPSALFSMNDCLLLTTPRNRDCPVFIKWEQWVQCFRKARGEKPTGTSL